MAEAKNVTFDSIMADLKARKFVPLYYLMGEEPYYIDRIADYIAATISQRMCCSLRSVISTSLCSSDLMSQGLRLPTMHVAIP